MTIEKINFSYPKGTLQSVYDTEEMTALELAAKTSKKVDECVDMVNGVEQIGIDATAIVDEMRIAQDQFMIDNIDYIKQDVNTKVDALIGDGTIESLINDQILNDVKQDVIDVDTKATTIDNKLKEVANLSDYCVGDGIADDTQGLIDAINTGKKVVGVKGKTYLVTTRIPLIDNTHIDGNGAIFLAKYTNPTYNIGDNIFYGFEVENVAIENCILDGGSLTFPRTNGLDAYQGNSLIKIEHSKQITIKNCRWQNYSQSWGGASDSFHVIAILQSTNVNIFDCVQRDVYPEGMLLENCKHVVLKGFTVDNLEASTVWSPLHLFFCDSVVVENIVLYTDSSGSSINFTCSNFYLKNAYVEGGAGLDLSNESGKPYQVKNGVIDNLTLIGGYVYTHPVDGGPIENVRIINSLFKPKDRLMLFRLDTPKNFMIKDCRVEAERTVTSSVASLLHIDVLNDNCENVVLENISFSGSIDRLAVVTSFGTQKFFKGIHLKNISGALSSNDGSSYSGNGSLITLRNSDIAEPNINVDDLVIENCNITNITGSVFHVYDYGYFKDVKIINSKLTGLNDRASAYPKNFMLVDSEIKMKLLFSGVMSQIEKFELISNLITGYNDTSNLIATRDETYYTLKNFTIKNNTIKELNRLIDIRNTTTHFDAKSCLIDVDPSLIRSSNSGDAAIISSMKKDGIIYVKQNVILADATTNRITNPAIGQSMYDTTINKPIWCKALANISEIDGSVITPAIWVDSTGTTV